LTELGARAIVAQEGERRQRPPPVTMTAPATCHPEPVRAKGGAWAFTALLFSLCLTVFYRLTQPCLHWFDSVMVLKACRDGVGQHHWHLLGYRPMLLAHELLEPWGFTVLQSCQALMAFGGAVTAAAGHRFARAVRLDTVAARWTAGLIAAAPATTYYATIVELQAMAMATTALAMWAFVALGEAVGRRAAPAAAGAVGVGALSAVGAAFHTSLHLLPLVFPWLALAGLWARPTWSTLWRRWTPVLLLIAGAHVALYALLLWVGTTADVTGGTRHLLASGLVEQMNSASLGQRLVGELLIPFLPCNLVVLTAIARRPSLAGLALLVGVAGAFAATVLALRTVLNDEYGAYLFCFVPCFAALAVRASSRRLWPALLLVALAAGAWLRWQQATAKPTDRALAEACRTLSRERGYTFLTADGVLIDSATLYAPDLKLYPYQLDQPLLAVPAEVAQVFDGLAMISLPGGMVIDDPTWERWRGGRSDALRLLVTEHLPAKYELTPVERGPFRGRVVTPKARGPR